MSSAWRSLSLKRVDQRRLRLVGLADDADHLVDVQQHQLPAFEDVDAVRTLLQPVLRAPLHGGLAELDPLGQHLAQALLRRPAVAPDHRQVDRRAGLQAGVRQQRGDRARRCSMRAASWARTPGAPRASLLDSSRTASSTASTVALSCTCSCVSAFLPALTLGLVSSSISSSTFCALVPGGSSVTTSCHWPRARSSIFQRARTFSSRGPLRVGVADVARAADDLAAAGEVGAGQQRRAARRRDSLSLRDQRHRGRGHLAQVVAGHLGGQAHRDARWRR